MNGLDYKVYTQRYLCGKAAVLPESDFVYYTRKAETVIHQYTFGRELPDSESVLFCCCELAELMFQSENTAESGVSAEKVGDLSVSYESARTRQGNLLRQMKSVVYRYLSNTNLLYKGCVTKTSFG